MSEITSILDSGVKAVGFVSPSHQVPQTLALAKMIREYKKDVLLVYNSNGYESVKTLKMLEGMVDVFLPDFKYMDPSIAGAYSDAPGYPGIASMAIREMYRQKGSTLIVNDDGYATQGLIVRHLVLPGHPENSKRVLRFLAEEISTNIHISLMFQYHPVAGVSDHTVLCRRVSTKEYKEVEQEMEKLGFTKGWVQEPESADNYLPDFGRSRPFD